MTKTLGKRIRELREESGVSLREFAKKLEGVTATHISDIELGRRFPSDELLKRIASRLHVSVQELRQYDARPPVEGMKRIIEEDPAYGFAFRALVEKQVSPEEIMKLAGQKPDRERKK